MLVFFILLTFIVQVGFLVVARSATASAVEGAVRSGSASPNDLVSVTERLERDLAATVPGSADAEVSVQLVRGMIEAKVRFDWVPPGPDLLPVSISVTRSAAAVVPP
jgi:hypothetical protein